MKRTKRAKLKHSLTEILSRIPESEPEDTAVDEQELAASEQELAANEHEDAEGNGEVDSSDKYKRKSAFIMYFNHIINSILAFLFN